MKFNKNIHLSLLVLQVVTVLVILAFLFTVKFIGGQIFNDTKDLYKRYFEDDTLIINDIPVAKDSPVISKEVLKQNNSGITNFLSVPLVGTVTSDFGERLDPFDNENKQHFGIDIAAEYGTDITASANGQVEKIGFDKNGYGNYIIIGHSKNLQTLYAHCSKITVNEGDTVKKGETVALVGNTGKSTGNHLHFEIIYGGVKVNPEWYLNFR